jgi:hypothetical protein
LLKATAGTRRRTTFSISGLRTHLARKLETQVEIERRVELFSEQQAETLIRDAPDVGRMINGRVASLARSERTRSR